jgi:hypothetical protein
MFDDLPLCSFCGNQMKNLWHLVTIGPEGDSNKGMFESVLRCRHSLLWADLC